MKKGLPHSNPFELKPAVSKSSLLDVHIRKNEFLVTLFYFDGVDPCRQIEEVYNVPGATDSCGRYNLLTTVKDFDETADQFFLNFEIEYVSLG